MQRGEFDPRFDPVFQPGFDPNVHRPRTRGVASQGKGADAAEAPHPATARHDPRFGAVRPARNEGTGEFSGDDTGDGPLEDAEAPVPLVRNPLMKALWFVSVGLIVVGVALTWWATGTSNSYSYSSGEGVPLPILLMQSAWVLSPAMIEVGLAGVVGLLFWYAARWKPPVGS